MKKIPTAKEMHEKMNKDLDEALFIDKEKWKDRDPIQEVLIEFAKLHVQAALEAAAENAQILERDLYDDVDKESILTAYSLENIK